MKKTNFLLMGLILSGANLSMAAVPIPTPEPAPTKQMLNSSIYDVFILKKKGRDKIQLFPDIEDENVKLEKPSDDDMVLANKDLEKWKDNLGKFEILLGF